MKQKKLFYTSAVGYLVSSGTILVMPFTDTTGQHGSKALAIITAAVFWLFLLIAVISQIQLGRIQKPYQKRGSPIGLALSPPTFWFELVFILSLVALLILFVAKINGYAVYALIFLMLVSGELSLLTFGKFAKKDGKLVLKIYKHRKYTKENN